MLLGKSTDKLRHTETIENQYIEGCTDCHAARCPEYDLPCLATIAWDNHIFHVIYIMHTAENIKMLDRDETRSLLEEAVNTVS